MRRETKARGDRPAGSRFSVLCTPSHPRFQGAPCNPMQTGIAGVDGYMALQWQAELGSPLITRPAELLSHGLKTIVLRMARAPGPGLRDKRHLLKPLCLFSRFTDEDVEAHEAKPQATE